MINDTAIAIVKRSSWATDEMADAVESRDTISAYLRGRYQDVREIDDKLLEKPQDLFSAGIRLIIVPTQRWFYESRFEGLIRFAEGGGIVLATYPSFWKTEAGEKVIDRRLFSLFWVDSKVLDRKVAGTMIFRPSTEAWLFEDLPTEISSDHWGWIITSTKGITEGEWRISNAYEWLSHDNPNSLDPDLSGRSSNLCLMRKWDSGGLFVYTCFHYGLSLKDDPRLGKLMDNMINRSPTTVGANLSFSERRFEILRKTGASL